jgi:hypothetical protein
MSSSSSFIASGMIHSTSKILFEDFIKHTPKISCSLHGELGEYPRVKKVVE